MTQFKLLAQGLLLCTLVACQAPTSPSGDNTTETNTEASSTPDNTAGVNVDANVGVNVGENTSSTDANSSMTVEANGNTYTRGQLKAFYECGAAGSSPLKGSAAQMLTDIKAADEGNPAAAAIYVRAATNVPNFVNLTGCEI